MFSGALKRIAVKLSKICNDLRLCKHHSEMSLCLQSRSVTTGRGVSKAFVPVDPTYRRAQKPCGIIGGAGAALSW